MYDFKIDAADKILSSTPVDTNAAAAARLSELGARVVGVSNALGTLADNEKVGYVTHVIFGAMNTSLTPADQKVG